ncbi:hypothetical protein [Sphingopyxis panaciterrae]
MKSLPASAAMALIAAALAWPSIAAAKQVEMPAELTGVWRTKDADGEKQCAAYRKDPVMRDDGYDPLVGSAVIQKRLILAYAEYGEGNFYKVDWVSQTGPQSWLVRSYLYIDTVPSEAPGEGDDESAAYLSDTMTLKSTTLTWTGPETETRTLFRCGDIVE